MKTVWKYSLPLQEANTDVYMPKGAEVLRLGTQVSGGIEGPYLWVLVNPEHLVEPRTFITVGTGHAEVPEKAHYVGTYQISWFVGHVFELV